MNISAYTNSLLGIPCQDLERFDADWKVEIEDFKVEEIPLYEPSGRVSIYICSLRKKPQH